MPLAMDRPVRYGYNRGKNTCCLEEFSLCRESQSCSTGFVIGTKNGRIWRQSNCLAYSHYTVKDASVPLDFASPQTAEIFCLVAMDTIIMSTKNAGRITSAVHVKLVPEEK